MSWVNNIKPINESSCIPNFYSTLPIEFKWAFPSFHLDTIFHKCFFFVSHSNKGGGLDHFCSNHTNIIEKNNIQGQIITKVNPFIMKNSFVLFSNQWDVPLWYFGVNHGSSPSIEQYYNPCFQLNSTHLLFQHSSCTLLQNNLMAFFSWTLFIKSFMSLIFISFLALIIGAKFTRYSFLFRYLLYIMIHIKTIYTSNY